jgi:anti-sigma factor RsiW
VKVVDMDCERFRDQMLDALQGTASAELEEHARACGACAQELKVLKQTSALLEEWPAPEASPYFDSRLRARLREQAAAPVGWWAWLRKPALAATFAILLVMGVGLLDLSKPQTQSPVAVRPLTKAHRGTAVADLQTLDQNQELYATFDLLDEIPADQANP